jgi:AraC-like DNA-binding protein
MAQMILAIQKMPSPSRNYFRYFSHGPSSTAWGQAVTACGYTEVAAGAAYPPMRHPSDHDLDWEQGRTLTALQVVMISEGWGWFESQPTGRKRIRPGSAFIVLPGVWHRYRPDPSTGWTESWVEINGTTVEQLKSDGVLQAQSAVRQQAEAGGLSEALDAVHAWARAAGPGFEPELSVRALGVLAAWWRASGARPAQTPTLRAVIEAERYLSAHYTEPVNISALAKRLGVAYSHFRRQFRVHTGYAPWQFIMRVRLVRAKRLLAENDSTLDEIADQLGFSSAFHLSFAFKQAFSAAPDHWRRKSTGRYKKRAS